ncbi:hypothetical protein DCAR_0520820 [Daucus carota subsp. sativus]|uniref:Uncharacterized protein n=1 Tax=Daucus carota subsp. sativus TaxID=79200 RepID=A0A164YTJ5_DAUCS|nr:hypothetical protein DCAR_0520820 [Daucus carota subsp. sativus]
MSLQRSAFRVLFFIIIVTSQVVSCRVLRAANQTRSFLPSSELQHLSSSSSFEDLTNKNIDITHTYTASKKVVPGGPNPLHN